MSPKTKFEKENRLIDVNVNFRKTSHERSRFDNRISIQVDPSLLSIEVEHEKKIQREKITSKEKVELTNPTAKIRRTGIISPPKPQDINSSTQQMNFQSPTQTQQHRKMDLFSSPITDVNINTNNNNILSNPQSATKIPNPIFSPVPNSTFQSPTSSYQSPTITNTFSSQKMPPQSINSPGIQQTPQIFLKSPSIWSKK